MTKNYNMNPLISSMIISKQKNLLAQMFKAKYKYSLTFATANDGNLENAFERTSSLTSLPRSPQNNRKSSTKWTNTHEKLHKKNK